MDNDITKKMINQHTQMIGFPYFFYLCVLKFQVNEH